MAEKVKEIYLRYLSRNLDRISFSSKRNVTPSRSIFKTHFSSLVSKLLASFRNVWRCGRGRGRRRGRCTHATVANFIIYIYIGNIEVVIGHAAQVSVRYFSQLRRDAMRGGKSCWSRANSQRAVNKFKFKTFAFHS